MRVHLINPLPEALEHYEHALQATLTTAGAHVAEISRPSIEGRDRHKAKRAAEHMRALWRTRDFDGLSILMWPSFGYLELPVDWALCPKAAVIFHDAEPMRTQGGMSLRQGRLVAPLSRGRRSPAVIVHTRRASEGLERLGWSPSQMLPFPLLRAAAAARPPSQMVPPRCLVLGQHKESRTLDLLSQLPPLLPDFELRIVGRGWPEVAQWHVRSEFLSLEDFDQELRSATVILVPYADYFQSGVVVHAFEAAIPVVTPPHEQTDDLYGGDWPGTATSWAAGPVAEAIRAAAAVPRTHVADRFQRLDLRSVEEWGRFLDSRF